MANFYDQNYLPGEAQYYFNIVVINVRARPEELESEEFWSLEKITEPRPIAWHFIPDETIEDECDWYMDIEPHCVVEVTEQFGVQVYQMLDFETEDPWRI